MVFTSCPRFKYFLINLQEWKCPGKIKRQQCFAAVIPWLNYPGVNTDTFVGMGWQSQLVLANGKRSVSRCTDNLISGMASLRRKLIHTRSSSWFSTFPSLLIGRHLMRRGNAICCSSSSIVSQSPNCLSCGEMSCDALHERTSASHFQRARAVSMWVRSWGRDVAGALRGPDGTHSVVGQNQKE